MQQTTSRLLDISAKLKETNNQMFILNCFFDDDDQGILKQIADKMKLEKNPDQRYHTGQAAFMANK